MTVTRSMESQTEGREGLVDPAQTNSQTQAVTSGHSRNDMTDPMVKNDKRQTGQYGTYKYSAWTMLTSVFRQLARIQTRVQILIAACIMSLVSSVHTSMYQKKRPSKYKAQLYDTLEP